MKTSLLTRVVFTPGSRDLAAFAASHFLPEHPLASSPLWLDEDDFSSIQQMARRLGKPSPLRMAPLAHHPLQSPFRSAAPTEAKGEAVNTTTAIVAAGRRNRSRTEKTCTAPPAAAAAVSCPPPAATVDRADASQRYVVPICSHDVVKPLYLYNLEQMYLTELKSTASPATPSVSGDAADAAKLQVWSETALLQHGARELRRRFALPLPNESRVMQSIQSKQAYGAERQQQLLAIAEKRGYRSCWWGTPSQWHRIGATALPGQREHVVPVVRRMKLVHVSLVDNAAEVLTRSFISVRHRRLVYFFDDDEGNSGDCADTSEGEPLTIARPRPIANTGRHLYDDTIVKVDSFLNAALAAKTPTPQSSFTKSRSAVFQSLLREDMRSHGYSLPLYFSGTQLQSLGLLVRPDALGIEWNTAISQNGHLSSPFQRPSPLKSQSVRHLYHLSQIRFPSHYLISPEVIAAELEHPGVALHGISGCLLPYAALCYEALVNQHPDIAALLWKCSDAALQTSRSDKSDHSAAGAAASPQEAQGEIHEAYIASVVRQYASPNCLQGRSIWFFAEDVLQLNGKVNVNAAPVKVVNPSSAAVVAGSHASGGDANQGIPSQAWFNVECLMDGDEALRVLSMPFKPM